MQHGHLAQSYHGFWSPGEHLQQSADLHIRTTAGWGSSMLHYSTCQLSVFLPSSLKFAAVMICPFFVLHWGVMGFSQMLSDACGLYLNCSQVFRLLLITDSDSRVLRFPRCHRQGGTGRPNLTDRFPRRAWKSNCQPLAQSKVILQAWTGCLGWFACISICICRILLLCQ